jgi:hypothetical protein
MSPALRALSLSAAAIVLAGSAFIYACASGDSSNPNCTCASDEKFDGDGCVASADFTAPTDCTDDGTAVCGCDGNGYTSECEAYAEGVQVANPGKCSDGSGGSGGGVGW